MPKLLTLSREKFYELVSLSFTRHEFHGGHIFAVGGESPIHGRIVASTIRVLGDALLDTRCFAVPCTQMVRIEADDMDVYPDVVIYCEDAAFDSLFPDTLTEPLALIEVLSPSTKHVDLTTKRTAYFKLPTLTDYLIVWQDKIRLDQFVRAANPTDQPELHRHLTRNSRVRLDSRGIEFSLGELYRRLDTLTEGEL